MSVTSGGGVDGVAITEGSDGGRCRRPGDRASVATACVARERGGGRTQTARPGLRSAIPAVLLVLSVAGCVYIPPVGRQIDEKDLGKISVGVTTRKEVLDLLGKPDIDTGRFILHKTYSSKGEFVTLPPFWVNLEPIVIPIGASAYRILLHFDGEGVVDRFEAEAFDGNPASFGTPRPATGSRPDVTLLPRRTLFGEKESFWSGATTFYAVAVSHDGKLVAASDSRNRVWRDDLQTGELTRIDIDANIVSLAFSPDDRKLAVLGRTVKILKVPPGEQVASFGGHGDEIFWRWRGATALAFAPDGRTVATGGGAGKVKLWDPETTAETRTFQAHDGWVLSVAFSPEGGLLATAGTDGSTRLWHPESGMKLAEIPRTGHVVFSPSGRRLAIATFEHVEVWRVLPGREAGPSISAPVVEGPVNMFIRPVVVMLRARTPEFKGLSVAFSPDEKFIAACGGGVSIWELPSSRQRWRMVPGGKPTFNRPFGSDWIYDCSFSPDGKHLVTAGDDAVLLWDISRLRARPPGGPGGEAH